jgi:hypothetical protein
MQQRLLEMIMNRPSLPLTRRLQRDQFLRFAHPRGLCLRADSGTLWVTVDGEPDDIEIGAGDCRSFDGDRPLLVGSFRGDAVVSARATRSVPRWREWFGLSGARVLPAG